MNTWRVLQQPVTLCKNTPRVLQQHVLFAKIDGRFCKYWWWDLQIFPKEGQPKRVLFPPFFFYLKQKTPVFFVFFKKKPKKNPPTLHHLACIRYAHPTRDGKTRVFLAIKRFFTGFFSNSKKQTAFFFQIPRNKQAGGMGKPDMSNFRQVGCEEKKGGFFGEKLFHWQKRSKKVRFETLPITAPHTAGVEGKIVVPSPRLCGGGSCPRHVVGCFPRLIKNMLFYIKNILYSFFHKKLKKCLTQNKSFDASSQEHANDREQKIERRVRVCHWHGGDGLKLRFSIKTELDCVRWKHLQTSSIGRAQQGHGWENRTVNLYRPLQFQTSSLHLALGGFCKNSRSLH